MFEVSERFIGGVDFQLANSHALFRFDFREKYPPCACIASDAFFG
jgi:hypothetical protein